MFYVIDMDGNKNLILIGLIVAAIIIAVLIFNRSDSQSDSEPVQDQSVNRTDRQNIDSSSGNVSGDSVTNLLEGILLESDNLKKGNLLLVRTEGDIYLRTSRDYSEFLNQEVVVKIEGNTSKFELRDVKLK